MPPETFHNQHLLADEPARRALARLVDICRSFAMAIPSAEEAQADGLLQIIDAAGRDVRDGTLRLAATARLSEPVIRLFKDRAGDGRLKLQLFPLDRGQSHPPHAHHDLLSCQVLLAGRARVHEYCLVGRPAPGAIEIRQEPVKTLAPGDGVYTLQFRNHVHWQEGLADGSVLLNINWQGYLFEADGEPGSSRHGRRYLDWNRKRPSGVAGHYVVPELAST